MQMPPQVTSTEGYVLHCLILPWEQDRVITNTSHNLA